MHNRIWHLSYEVYNMNLQYVGRNETPFKIRLSNHRKDVKDTKAILADKHIKKLVIDLIIDLTNTKDS